MYWCVSTYVLLSCPCVKFLSQTFYFISLRRTYKNIDDHQKEGIKKQDVLFKKTLL